MKTYLYLTALVTVIVLVAGIIVYTTTFKQIEDINGETDTSLATFDLAEEERSSLTYTAKNREFRDTDDYSYFTSDKVSGIIVLREIRPSSGEIYVKFDVDLSAGNCEIMVKDQDNNLIHTVNTTGISSIMLPEYNGFYYVVMGVESANVEVTVQSSSDYQTVQ